MSVNITVNLHNFCWVLFKMSGCFIKRLLHDSILQGVLENLGALWLLKAWAYFTIRKLYIIDYCSGFILFWVYNKNFINSWFNRIWNQKDWIQVLTECTNQICLENSWKRAETRRQIWANLGFPKYMKSLKCYVYRGFNNYLCHPFPKANVQA